MVESNFNIDAPRFFLGDKGYANDNTMIVPIKENSVKTQAEKQFNIILGKARVIIEHTFGIWKKMWPILMYKLRKDRSLNSQATILSTVVLHNISRKLREEVPEMPSKMSLKQFDKIMKRDLQSSNTNEIDNSYLRNRIISKHFS